MLAAAKGQYTSEDAPKVRFAESLRGLLQSEFPPGTVCNSRTPRPKTMRTAGMGHRSTFVCSCAAETHSQMDTKRLLKQSLPGAKVKDKRKQRIRGMRRAPDAAINVRDGNTERGSKR